MLSKLSGNLTSLKIDQRQKSYKLLANDRDLV